MQKASANWIAAIRRRLPMIRRWSVLLAIGLACLVPACKQAEVPDTRAADESAIRDIVAAWNKAVAAKDVDGSISCYSDDGSLLIQNRPIVTGKEGIRAYYANLLAMPGFSLAIQSAMVEVARSGDLAYERGTYRMTVDGPDGKPVTNTGKYVGVYRKGADGIWKLVADIANSDSPAAPPSQ
jgi:uncharacterized protein (TIGR02246 family)